MCLLSGSPGTIYSNRQFWLPDSIELVPAAAYGAAAARAEQRHCQGTEKKRNKGLNTAIARRAIAGTIKNDKKDKAMQT